jgi:hypothetical protein
MAAHSEGQTNIICKTNDGNFTDTDTDTCTVYIIDDHISHVIGIYIGNVIINNTDTVTNVELDIFYNSTALATYNDDGVEMQFNTTYISCSYKTFFENSQYKIKGFSESDPDANLNKPSISCEGVFDEDGYADVVFDVKTEPLMHIVLTEKKQTM